MAVLVCSVRPTWKTLSENSRCPETGESSTFHSSKRCASRNKFTGNATISESMTCRFSECSLQKKSQTIPDRCYWWSWCHSAWELLHYLFPCLTPGNENCLNTSQNTNDKTFQKGVAKGETFNPFSNEHQGSGIGFCSCRIRPRVLSGWKVFLADSLTRAALTIGVRAWLCLSVVHEFTGE